METQGPCWLISMIILTQSRVTVKKALGESVKTCPGQSIEIGRPTLNMSTSRWLGSWKESKGEPEQGPSNRVPASWLWIVREAPSHACSRAFPP